MTPIQCSTRTAYPLAAAGTLILNTDSAASLEEKGDQLRISLLRGELAVQTAANKQRQIIVMTKEAVLTPLGTEFSARQLAGETILHVQRDSVMVRNQAGDTQRINAGEGVHITSTSITPLSAAEAAQAQAWLKGMLVANDMPLADFIAELERYYPRKLRVAPELAVLRVSGAFPIADPERVIEMLSVAYPVVPRRAYFGLVTEIVPK